MNTLKSLLKSVWVWLAIISVVTFVSYRISLSQTKNDDRIEVAHIPIPAALFSLTTKGAVEIEGGIINVSASRTGTFRTVYVKEGDFVKIGQLLAEQEDRDDKISINNVKIEIENIHVQLQQDKLTLEIHNRALERAQIQRDQDAISQREYDGVVDKLESAKLATIRLNNNLRIALTRLETAKFKLTQRQLKSPVNGQILEAAITAGAGVSAENVTTAFTIIPDAPKQVRLKLAEKNTDKVFVGQSVDVSKSLSSEVVYKGRVASISEVFSSALGSGASPGRNAANTVDVIIEVEKLPYRLGKTVFVKFRKANFAGSVTNDEK
ncbi:MAG: hypothetical protein COA43_14215 [Robiginitomaculum sp.]|nr:MAG: hypothetical protein COA43_14215 [Robiginitomaculum sp.]